MLNILLQAMSSWFTYRHDIHDGFDTLDKALVSKNMSTNKSIKCSLVDGHSDMIL